MIRKKQLIISLKQNEMKSEFYKMKNSLKPHKSAPESFLLKMSSKVFLFLREADF